MVAARYTRTAMILHWLIAALITANVILAWATDWFPDDLTRPLIDTHKSIGITVLGLGVVRVLWRVANVPPALPESYPRWEKITAHTAHAVLYLLIFCLPLSGWMHDSAWKDQATHPMSLFNIIPWPRIGFITSIAPDTREVLHDWFGLLHTSLAYVLYVMVLLHVAGALKHQFIDKHSELQRMLP